MRVPACLGVLCLLCSLLVRQVVVRAAYSLVLDVPADAPQQPTAHRQHSLGLLGQRPGARPAASGSHHTDWEVRCAYGSNGRPLEAHKQWCALLSLQGGLGSEGLPGEAQHASPCGAKYGARSMH